MQTRTEFLVHVKKQLSGHWKWLGKYSRDGYGFVQYQGRKTRAHRAAYLLFVGPISDGLWVLHHCDRPWCVNPEHLWLGTASDNSRDRDQKGRGGHIGKWQAAKTHCPQGHPYSEENTYHNPATGRVCRICNNKAAREYYQRKKERNSSVKK